MPRDDKTEEEWFYLKKASVATKGIELVWRIKKRKNIPKRLPGLVATLFEPEIRGNITYELGLNEILNKKETKDLINFPKQPERFNKYHAKNLNRINGTYLKITDYCLKKFIGIDS
jgi:hypothetical protein